MAIALDVILTPQPQLTAFDESIHERFEAPQPPVAEPEQNQTLDPLNELNRLAGVARQRELTLCELVDIHNFKQEAVNDHTRLIDDPDNKNRATDSMRRTLDSWIDLSAYWPIMQNIQEYSASLAHIAQLNTLIDNVTKRHSEATEDTTRHYAVLAIENFRVKRDALRAALPRSVTRADVPQPPPIRDFPLYRPAIPAHYEHIAMTTYEPKYTFRWMEERLRTNFHKVSRTISTAAAYIGLSALAINLAGPDSDLQKSTRADTAAVQSGLELYDPTQYSESHVDTYSDQTTSNARSMLSVSSGASAEPVLEPFVVDADETLYQAIIGEGVPADEVMGDDGVVDRFIDNVRAQGFIAGMHDSDGDFINTTTDQFLYVDKDGTVITDPMEIVRQHGDTFRIIINDLIDALPEPSSNSHLK